MHGRTYSATALGQSLSIGCNKSLLSLKLDYNPSLGSEGTAALCRGLRTNSSLKQLHLPYCDLGADAGAPLGEMLSYTKLQLAVLNLQVHKKKYLCGVVTPFAVRHLLATRLVCQYISFASPFTIICFAAFSWKLNTRVIISLWRVHAIWYWHSYEYLHEKVSLPTVRSFATPPPPLTKPVTRTLPTTAPLFCAG